jgi:hypothetical protein
MKHYSPTGRRNHGRPLKRLLDAWDRNGSTSGPTLWQICNDNDDDDITRYKRPFKPFNYETAWFKAPVRTAQLTLSAWVIKTNKFLLYREIIAVCSDIYTEYINAMWAEHRISER